MKKPTTSSVHPSSSNATLTVTEPQTINGLRRPHFDVDLSVIAPTTGTIIKPERGPAIQTSDVFDFESPRRSKYGVQSGSRRQRRNGFGLVKNRKDETYKSSQGPR